MSDTVFSPDGRMVWDGAKWIPRFQPGVLPTEPLPPPHPPDDPPAVPQVATIPTEGYPQQVTISGWSAFKAGFYAFFGFALAAFLLGLIPTMLFLMAAGSVLSRMATPTPTP